MMISRVTHHGFEFAIILAATWGCTALAETIPQEFTDGLASEEFRVREESESKLLKWSREKVEIRALLLLEQAREATDPEVRQRSHDVLHALAMDDYLREGEGYMGIQMVALRAQVPGDPDGEPREVISITRVLRETPAREAGMRVGDMITSVNGEKLKVDNALDSFQEMIRDLKPGTPTRFQLIRDGVLMEVIVTLGRRPPLPEGRFFGQQMPDINELARRDQEAFFNRWLEKLEN